jgi:hypothetical protein
MVENIAARVARKQQKRRPTYANAVMRSAPPRLPRAPLWSMKNEWRLRDLFIVAQQSAYSFA